MKKRAKFIAVIAAFAILVATAVGTTLAWLTAETGPVTNTFTFGDINITLTESDDLDLKIVPGKEITKDPKVTVKQGSEDCWLFIKIEKSANFDTFFDNYVVADGWTELAGQTGVYYREVEYDASDDQEFAVIKDNKVVVKKTVTKAEIKDATAPTLTFTAYAAQKEGLASAAAAWDAF